MYHRRSKLMQGFSLVELLVVLVIVGLLIALLLPALFAAREASHLSTCKSNLRQLSVGMHLYHEAHGSFPHGGWGFTWIGIADRGYGEDQPGGWAYSLLPFVEQEVLHSVDRDVSVPDADQIRAIRLATPLSIHTCPSRRASRPLEVSNVYADSPTITRPHLREPRRSSPVTAVARSDYAVNSGSTFVISNAGPITLRQGDSDDFSWPTPKHYDGVCHLRLGAKSRSFVDGLSNTYLLGEKFLDPDHYVDGLALGDNETLYTGYSSDLHRFTREDLRPLRDQPLDPSVLGDWSFGSAHRTSFNIAMADGSVRSIGYDIAADVHRDNGTRKPPFERPEKRRF